MNDQKVARAHEVTKKSWRRSDRLAEVRRDGRTTVLDLSRTNEPAGPTPYVLNGSALDIWCLLDLPRTIDEIATEIAQQVGTDPTTLVGDVARFVENLASLGLICSTVSDRGRTATPHSQGRP